MPGDGLGQLTHQQLEERVREIARMLGGESVTETSRQHALELLNQARPR